MGKCSVSGLQHGDLVDNNLQAYPAEIHCEFTKQSGSIILLDFKGLNRSLQ